MSSLESEILKITPNLPVPELIKRIRYSFREFEYNEVQKILMKREKTMRMEMETVEKDRDSIKEQVLVLERTQSLTELENSKLETKLEKSHKKCDELEETVTSLIEEQRVSSDREKKAKERYDKVLENNSKMKKQKDKIICELNDKVTELENKNSEMAEEIKNLRHEKWAADQIADKLGVKLLESDKAAEVNEKMCESLTERVMKMEEALANGLIVNVEDIANIVDKLEQSAAGDEGPNVKSQNSKGEKDILGNDITRDGGNGDSENVAGVLPEVRSTCNSTGIGCSGLPKKDGTTTVQTSPGAQSGCDPPEVQSNGTGQENGNKEPQGSDSAGPNASDMGSGKIAHSIPAPDIIEISESDDETNLDTRVNADENEVIFVKCVQNPSSSQTNKRKRTELNDGSPINLSSKRKRNVPIDNKQNKVPESDSDDESCTDSCMDNFVASLRSEQVGRKWRFKVDMLNAYQEDPELCMNAVCALYRQQILAEKGSNSSKSGGFNPIDAMSGRALAEYLINKDPELRLTKSVSEVKKDRVDVISQCKRLAIIYHEKLFDIYCSGEDPLFCQT